MAFETLENRLLQLRRDADRADSLHIGMSADGHKTGVRASHHAAQQRQIRDGLNVFDAVHVMGNAHCPAKNRGLRGGVELGQAADLAFVHAALGFHLRPR